MAVHFSAPFLHYGQREPHEVLRNPLIVRNYYYNNVTRLCPSEQPCLVKQPQELVSDQAPQCGGQYSPLWTPLTNPDFV